MSFLARRDLLAALVALTASSALPALAKQDGAKQDGAKQDGAKQDGAKQDGAKQDGAKATPAFDDLDHDAVERIGRAWLAQNPGVSTPALAKRLFPDGRGPSTLAGLRQRAAQDFRESKVFVHRGWRLSDTEGALFGLLALET